MNLRCLTWNCPPCLTLWDIFQNIFTPTPFPGRYLVVGSFLLKLKIITMCFELKEGQRLQISLFLEMLQVANRIGIHRRLFWGDNLISKNYKKFPLLKSLFNQNTKLLSTGYNSNKVYRRCFYEGSRLHCRLRIWSHLTGSWKLRIWSHLLKKSLMENFIFCAVL